jgi:hypothetical protein
MRHITERRLDMIEPLLARLRAIDGLTERKRGVFYRRSHAFLHFHEHADEVYADAKLDGRAFERFRVTTKTEQHALVAAVRRALR